MSLNNLPQVSVVIPLYNKRATIQRAINSVLSQGVSDLEIIVVDDGSTDGSAERVEAMNDTRLTLIRQQNAGPGRARNAGASCARGNLFAFLDGDDEWKPDFLSAAIDALLRNPDAVAYACSFDSGAFADHVVDKVSRLTSKPVLLPPPSVKVGHKWMKEALDGLHSSSTIMRRSAFIKAGGYYDAYRCMWGEDSYLWGQILFMGPIFWDPTPRIFFHVEDSELGYAVKKRDRARPLAERGRELMKLVAPEHRAAFFVLAQRTALDDSNSLADSGHLLKSLLLQGKYRLFARSTTLNVLRLYVRYLKRQVAKRIAKPMIGAS